MGAAQTDYNHPDRVDAAFRTDSSYCTTCGWLLPAGARATCAACGGDATPLPLADNTRPVPREEEADSNVLAARELWVQGEHARALALALTFGASPRTFSSPQGPGWVSAVGATPVYVVLEVASSQVTLEIPVVRLPQAKRVPALRAALALCNEIAAASRFCLRIDLLVARCTARLDALSPALVRVVAREMAALAVRVQEHLALAFDARPAIPEQGVLSAWDRVGRSQALPLLAPPSFTAPVSQPRPPSSSHPGSRPSSMRPPGMGIPPPAQPRAITLRLSIPPVLAAEEDDMPAILAPDMADERPSPPSIPPTVPPPASRPADSPSSRPSMLPSALPHVPALGLRAPFPTGGGVVRTNTPQELEPPPATRRPIRPAPADTSTPEGKLCELLRQALALATALSFQERPQTMLLLVRAAVFRAVFECSDAVPHAVAYLYRATRSVTREIWTTRPDPVRPLGPMPLAEPALGALEQILTVRGLVPKEKPASIDGWPTALVAKEQLGKYVSEIEIAPQDPVLRHYLALGALSELLARARLPAQTDQRLRDIVAYAQRDGAKLQVVELMMTALRKIVSG